MNSTKNIFIDKIINFLIIGILTLYSYQIYEINLYFILSALLIIILYRLIKINNIIIIVVVYFSLTLFLYLGYNWFSIIEYLSSLTLLLVSLILFFCISKMSFNQKFFSLLKFSFYVIIILGIFQFIMSAFGVTITYSNDFFYLSSNPSFGLYAKSYVFRIKSIYSEPSWYAISLFAFFLILYASKNLKRYDYYITFLIAILTFSLTGIIVIVNILLLLVLKSVKTKKLFALVVGMISMILLIYFLLPIDSLNYIITRMITSINGNDPSTSIRFTRGEILLSNVLSDFRLFGVGLGNETTFSSYIGLFSKNNSSGLVYINNFFHYVFITLGFVGSLLICINLFILLVKGILQIKHKEKNYKIIYLILIYLIFNIFTNGFILTPIFWIPLGILISIKNQTIKIRKA